MQRKLPILIVFLTAFLGFLFIVSSTRAQVVTTPPPVNVQDEVPAPGLEDPDSQLEGQWVKDKEVTFVGKTASRSGDFLDWTLRNYDWMCVQRTNGQCDNSANPLRSFHGLIQGIVYAILIATVMVAAFVMIVTRGRNLTLMRYIPRFIFILLLIVFSYSLIQFIYIITDLVQGFFLRVDEIYISTKDLLYIGFDYKTFTGYRLVGVEYEESAFITLLLVKLTAITYYVMTGMLLVRKIILWFFIILSPVFPLLLFFRPVRNTGKIWIGEFFRWLLYAPLFAIFLHGLVVMWQQQIPLPFEFNTPGRAVNNPDDIVYPTAVNILIGGPRQAISIDNSVNLQDTFALYVVALIMLWVVILLPWLLLKIFLDYINNVSFSESTLVKRILNNKVTPLSGGSPPPPPVAPPPTPPGAGFARALPFMKKEARPIEVSRTNITNIKNITSIPANTEILKMTNLSVPKMTDIAKYESSLLSQDTTRRQEVTKMRQSLSHIANPNLVTNPAERQRLTIVRDKLVQQRQKGNPLAGNILQAAHTATDVKVNELTDVLRRVANPQVVVTPVEQQKYQQIKQDLTTASQGGDQVAQAVLKASEKVTQETVTAEEKAQVASTLKDTLISEKQKGNKTAETVLDTASVASGRTVGMTSLQSMNLPAVNRVQQVSIEDYEEVKKMWTESYNTMTPPKSIEGNELSREEWVKSDVDKINQVINLLNAADPHQVSEGMEMVANILPFLLIGGFSRTEVIAYLKAKLEAGKTVLQDINKKSSEEDTMLDRSVHKEQAQKTLEQQVEIPEEIGPDEPLQNEDKSTPNS